MPEGLERARQIAEQVRFSGDSLKGDGAGNAAHTAAVKSHYLESGLPISPAVTPELSERLDAVYDRLAVPPHSVEAFVYASPEIQADCFAGCAAACAIRFSSALVDLLDEQEFGFVAGHELGHFLLGHGLARAGAQASPELAMQQRAQEISVDRLGLLACGSLDVALRALMKTASGLSSRHLRFDVSTFVAQLQKTSNSSRQANLSDTHPSILVRCRALLWFSLNDAFTRGGEAFNAEQMAKLDARIEADLEKYVDGPVRERIQQAKDDVALWLAAREVVQDESFDKREQAVFAEMFGEALLEKLKGFLGNIEAAAVEETVHQRVTSARSELEHAIPESFESEMRKIEARVSSRFPAR